MANYATLKAAIEEVITSNGNYEISGEDLRETLKEVVNSLGANYQFVGLATPETDPGTPDQNVAYLAGPGTYPNFGPTTVKPGEIGIFKYNGTWDVKVVQTDTTTDVININAIANHPAGYATPALALADVPERYRKLGCTVVFKDDTTEEWVMMIYKDDFGGDDAWTDIDNNWRTIGPVYLRQSGIGDGNYILQIGLDTNFRIINNFDSDTPYHVLSAKQGRLLNEKIEGWTQELESIDTTGVQLPRPLLQGMIITKIEGATKLILVGQYEEAITPADLPYKMQHNAFSVKTESETATDVTIGVRGVLSDDFINVNDYYGHSAAYANAQAARADVALTERKKGLYITYLLSVDANTTLWVTDQFIGDDITNWGVADNWKVIGPVSVSQNTLSIGGNYAGEMSTTYDVTLHNSGATFASLSVLLSDANLDTLIPIVVRKGGMSIKFVKSSDNKYVQYRLMAQTFSTTESDWQGVDDEPTAESENLVKSRGVYVLGQEVKSNIKTLADKLIWHIGTFYDIRTGLIREPAIFSYSCSDILPIEFEPLISHIEMVGTQTEGITRNSHKSLYLNGTYMGYVRSGSYYTPQGESVSSIEYNYFAINEYTEREYNPSYNTYYVIFSLAKAKEKEGKIFDKSFYALGDSTTFGAGSTTGKTSWADILNTLAGFISFTKLAANGALCMYHPNYARLSTQVNSVPSDYAGIITIMIGTNDFMRDSPLGDSSVTMSKNYGVLSDTDNFADSFRYNLETLKRKCPDAIILCITPLPSRDAGNEHGHWDETNLFAIRQIERDICNAMGIPIIESAKEFGLSRYVYDWYHFYSDFVHPNDLGYERMAHCMLGKFIEYCQ